MMGLNGNVSIRSLTDISSFIKLLIAESYINEEALALHQSCIFAVFLYTDEDFNLATYVRNHMIELHRMSGEQCIFFVIQKPTHKLVRAIQEDFGNWVTEYFKEIWKEETIDAEDPRYYRYLEERSMDLRDPKYAEYFEPFDKTQAYVIGEYFKVKQSQFPCIVFFSDLTSNRRFIVELNKFVQLNNGQNSDISLEYTKFFRILFTVVQEAAEKARDKRLLEIKRLLTKEWEASTQKPIDWGKSAKLAETGMGLVKMVSSFFV